MLEKFRVHVRMIRIMNIRNYLLSSVSTNFKFSFSFKITKTYNYHQKPNLQKLVFFSVLNITGGIS